eukprot:411996-Pyramimonas_sp.AAC.1
MQRGASRSFAGGAGAKCLCKEARAAPILGSFEEAKGEGSAGPGPQVRTSLRSTHARLDTGHVVFVNNITSFYGSTCANNGKGTRIVGRRVPFSGGQTAS